MQLLVGLATEVCRAFNKSLGDNLFQGLIMIIFGTFSKTARLDGGGGVMGLSPYQFHYQKI